MMNMSFSNRAALAIRKTGTRLCVGLDPDPQRILDCAPHLASAGDDAPQHYLFDVVNATAARCAAYKLNKPFYDSLPGGQRILASVVTEIRTRAPHALVILDAKIGDIENTMRFYFAHAFDDLGVDAVLLNPYMGSDVWTLLRNYPTRAGGLLVRTSNPSATELQDAKLDDGTPVWESVLRMLLTAAAEGLDLFPVLSFLTIGDAERVRRILPATMAILFAGVGSQGRDPAIAKALVTKDGPGPLVSVSRAIIYPQCAPGHHLQAIERAADTIGIEINQ